MCACVCVCALLCSESAVPAPALVTPAVLLLLPQSWSTIGGDILILHMMEYSWAHVFGEPWLLPRPDILSVFPHDPPFREWHVKDPSEVGTTG